MGQPSDNYPWQWSVYSWLDGKSINLIKLNNSELEQLAGDLADFIKELHKINTHNGPLGGEHNYYRGADLSTYDQEARESIFKLNKLINTKIASNLWEKALASKWTNPPVWVHGDMASGNLLMVNKKLNAVIDFGCMCVGDPACDLVVAWTILNHESREIFKAQLNLDQDTWARARGWALWKAMLELIALDNKESFNSGAKLTIIQQVLAENIE